MNKRIQKLHDEMERNKLRIAELTLRNKELRSAVKKQEDLEILGTVRSLNLSVDDVLALLGAAPEAPEQENQEKGE